MASSLEGPASQGYNITPSDSTVLSPIPRSIYIGASGNLAVQWVGSTTGGTTTSGSNIVFVSVLSGTFLPIRPAKVLATGTTAANLIAIY